MTAKLIAAAAVGAGLTVTVYEGTALLWPADAPQDNPIVVQAGDAHVVPASDPRGSHAAPTVDAVGGTAVDAGAPPEDVLAENQRLKLENALLKAQLPGAGGPVPFPEDLSPMLSPSGFSDLVQRAADRSDAVELLEIDCAEYPCMAAMRIAGGDRDEHELLREAMQAVEDTLGTDDMSAFVNLTREGDADALAILAPVTGEVDPDVEERWDQRSRDLAEGLRGPGGAPPR